MAEWPRPAAVLDRFDLLPLIEGLPVPCSRLVRRAGCPAFWDAYFVLESGEDCDATAETFEFCVSPRIVVVSAVYRAPDC